MALFQKSVLNQYLKQIDKIKVESAYQKFKAHFHNPIIQQQIRDSKEEQYQEGFLRDLFVDILGYTLNPQPNFNLTTELKNETNSKKVDGAILQNGNAIAVIELKGTNTTDLGIVVPQAFGYKNHQKECKYVIISNFEKLRFYIDNAIDFQEFNLFTLTENDFNLLYLCLHIDNIFSELPAKIKQASTVKEQDVTKQLYKDYSTFKSKLFTDIVQLNPQYDKLILFKKSQKLLDRILFILFAEDRGLLQANTIQIILDEYENLKKLDAYQPLYQRFKKHFTYLNEGFKNDKYEVFGYNGGLFANDEILDNILISDNLLLNYTPTLAKYDYETDVDVNILGHIFEHSLNDIEEIQAELDGKEIDKTKTKRKKDGVFYTPKYITKYIVENTVGALCTEKRKELEIIDDNYTPDKRKAHKADLKNKLDTYQSWLLQITIVDPACGSGAFLNQALDFLIQEHKNIDELRAQLLGESMVLSDHEVAILENNIFGVDLNEESVEIARLSLWLRTAQKGRKLNSLNNNIKCGNSLIDDASIAGEKAFNWQKEFPQIFESGGFDIVIGNPPYGAKVEREQIDYILKKSDNYLTGWIDTYVAFYFISIKLLKNNRFLGFITPDTWLTIASSEGLRKFIYKNCSLIDIYDRYKPFEDAKDTRCHTVILKNNIFNESSKIKITVVDSKQVIIKSFSLIQTGLENTNSWNLYTSPIEKTIFDKMIKNSINLDVFYNLKYGLRTGDNTKYLTYNIQESEQKIKIARGSNIQRYYFNWQPEYLKTTKDLPISYFEKSLINSPKIIIQYVRTNSTDINCKWLEATYIDEDNFVPLNSISFVYLKDMNSSLKFLLTLISSNLLNFYYKANYTDVNVKPLYLSKLPIPKIPLIEQQPFIEKAEIMLQKNKELQTVKSNVVKLLQSRYTTIKINTKIGNWNELSYKDFCKELDKQKIKLSITEQAELMQYFEAEQTKVNSIQQTINQTDKEIDTMVYKLYELTDEEISIVENN